MLKFMKKELEKFQYLSKLVINIANKKLRLEIIYKGCHKL
jgi:hypothetical protein